ncbi:hypothetical protein PybrP1_006168 [[Pythium] brassicae (nom. inval.)]|nr:hypothetical protein PybrP1_006168 [[Pythium] brassicae (nom. inval.)]
MLPKKRSKKIPRSSSPTTSDTIWSDTAAARVQVWKRLAECQKLLRELAFADNQQLWAIMDEALHRNSNKFANSAAREARKATTLPNYSDTGTPLQCNQW